MRRRRRRKKDWGIPEGGEEDEEGEEFTGAREAVTGARELPVVVVVAAVGRRGVTTLRKGLQG